MGEPVRDRMHAYAPPELSEPAITRIRLVAMFARRRANLSQNLCLGCESLKVTIPSPAIGTRRDQRHLPVQLRSESRLKSIVALSMRILEAQPIVRRFYV